MIDATDPPRLSDPGGDAPENVRQLLLQARADVGTDADLGELGARLAPLLATSAKVATTAGAVKLAAGAVAIAAAAVGVWAASAPSPAERAAEPSKAPAAALTAARPPEPAVEASAPDRPVTPPLERPAGTVDAKRLPAGRENEAELLGRAQQALAGSPALALTLAERHGREYPGGALAQEREVIAIEALARTGRRAEASVRARRFLGSHPGSAYRKKVSALIGTP